MAPFLITLCVFGTIGIIVFVMHSIFEGHGPRYYYNWWKTKPGAVFSKTTFQKGYGDKEVSIITDYITVIRIGQRDLVYREFTADGDGDYNEAFKNGEEFIVRKGSPFHTDWNDVLKGGFGYCHKRSPAGLKNAKKEIIKASEF